MKIAILPVIIVEGKYDKVKLESLVDGIVVATEGFGIFKDKAAQKNLRTLAAVNGAIILTDSDRAGFVIRKYLHDILKNVQLYDLYIPDVYGKEKRKREAGAEGKLGVEGMDTKVLKQLLASFEEFPDRSEGNITTADLYEFGLFGRENSADMRRQLQTCLDLPGRLNKSMLLKVLNRYFTKEQFYKEMDKMLK